MATTICYNSCPACGNAGVSKALTCRDFTVSQELFEVWECAACTLRFTQNIPSADLVGKYYQSENYISHSDTGKGFINSLYKLARRYTLGRKQKLVTQTTGLNTGQLLDVGCGTGAFAHAMKTAGWQVTGLEPDIGAREKAAALYGFEPLPSDALFDLPAASYNAITLWHVLEHVHHLHGYLQQFRKLLAPGGKLIIAVPNYTSPDATRYQQSWAAYDVPRHLYHFSPASLQALLKQHGLHLRKLEPMPLDAFYISMLSEAYLPVKGNVISGVWQGLKTGLATISDAKKASSVIYIFDKGDNKSN